MFVNFFRELKKAGLPVSSREYLTLIAGRDAGLARFDRVFGHCFKGLDAVSAESRATIPDEWLRKITGKFLSAEEKAQIQALGGWDKIMEELKRRLAEQKARHEGGSKWIRTGGTSPYGAYGYNPAGIRSAAGNTPPQPPSLAASSGSACSR